MTKKIILQIGAIALIIVASLGCSKSEMPKPILSEASVPVKDYDKLLAFFSRSIQVPKEKIRYDTSTAEFYIDETMVREKLERVEEIYKSANIYKLTIENK